MIQELLEEGADVNACDRSNGTPLYYAASRLRDSDGCLFLLQNGASPNVIYRRQRTCLHAMVVERQKTIVRNLLAFGADPTIQCPRRGDALDVANKTGDRELIDLIQKHLPQSRDAAPSKSSILFRGSYFRVGRPLKSAIITTHTPEGMASSDFICSNLL